MTILIRYKAKSFYALVISIGFLSNCSQAQEYDLEPVRIHVNDPTNREAKVSYTHEKKKNGQDQIGKITAILKIKSKNDQGFIASWTTESVEAGGVVIDKNSPQATGTMLLGVEMGFETGADGGPVRLLDREKLLASLPNSAAFANNDSETVDQVMNFFKSMDDDTIANVFFKVPSFMSVCQDTNFIIGEDNNFRTEQPSPFGAGVLSSNVSYQLTSLDTKNNEVNIKYRSEFDQESVKQLAIQAIEKLAPGAPISQKDIDELVVGRKDSADCVVDLSTGWVTEMKYSTKVSASGDTNEENFDISLNWKK